MNPRYVTEEKEGYHDPCHRIAISGSVEPLALAHMFSAVTFLATCVQDFSHSFTAQVTTSLKGRFCTDPITISKVSQNYVHGHSTATTVKASFKKEKELEEIPKNVAP